ncbi:F-box domain-containing protein [Artemisia annua]|uniref:F-box domain-containing protein n=1 Tax=Artemisia annua TaxID=35608 RepID=A0A2U1NHF1_ARTAN|nr:F-box domain-containing protein [Artemisia annua]
MAELYFPEEILNKIVVWLPTKSLFRFKCVSKHWNTVIPNYFMKFRRCRRMILLPVQPFHAIDNTVPYDHIDHLIIKRCSPFGNVEGKRVIIVGTFNGILLLAFKNQFPGKRVIIVGTFNGILLLAFKNQFPGHLMLYNPFTEESEIVPDPPLCNHTFTYNYGFGYGTTLDELKIFLIRYDRLDWNDDTCCHVFSFKDRSWSITSLWDKEYELWDARYQYDFIHDAEIKFPPKLGLRKKKKKRLTSNFPFPSIILGTLDGCLCIVCSNCSKLEVWVSKTHGFVESWEKRYTSTLVSRGNYLYKFEPFTILDDGKIVMLKIPNQVIILDILNDSDKEVNTVTTPEISGTQAFEYMETLVSPYDICSSLEDNEYATEVDVI